MRVNNNANLPLDNYEPNGRGGPKQDRSFAACPSKVSGITGRYPFTHPNDDFEQPRLLYKKVMSETEREHLAENIAKSLG
jgi:catalase